MTFDQKLELAKELIARREEIDAKLAELFGGEASGDKKSRACKRCGKPGHDTRTCAEELPAT